MNIVETLFGRTKTPAERLRQHQRALQKAQRELDRERSKLEQQEKKLILDIKNSARKGEIGPCKVMAKDLVRTRRYVSKFYTMKTQLQGVSLRIQGMRSNQQMAEAMKGATKAMNLMSRQLNLPQIQRILQDFEKESSMMDMKEEMMGDAIDDAMDDEVGETEEEEGDRILEEVLAEVGVSVGQQLGEAPTSLPAAALSEPGVRRAVAVGETSGGPSASSYGGGGAGASGGAGAGAAGGDGGLDDLQARLDNLRRD
ncbi:Snf7-domain-containing protein [Rhodotorula diobovata]|uniref:Snf7-domain-containing protein n=1 Tax=Rhodotorula diobovata TaxID=5288 RepID=A0A5C5FK83_9BASI|nr:Snf7-domain-containing protein [Rhodotorula diobovata]